VVSWDQHRTPESGFGGVEGLRRGVRGKGKESKKRGARDDGRLFGKRNEVLVTAVRFDSGPGRTKG